MQGYMEHAQDPSTRNGILQASHGCIMKYYKSMYKIKKLYPYITVFVEGEQHMILHLCNVGWLNVYKCGANSVYSWQGRFMRKLKQKKAFLISFRNGRD
jgi:hypothetical protein